MADYDLSIVIPARHEEFLNRTVDDILAAKRGKTQIIIGLDGEWPEVPLKVHPDVVVLFYPESIGQRAMTNKCVQLSRAKYIMKLDAHCALSEGFDVAMMADMQDDWTMAPTMRNLHAFDWICDQAKPRERFRGGDEPHRRYQSPSGPCKDCGKETHKEVIWCPKESPQSNSYCFDPEPHFQYFNEFSKRPEGKGEITESMSLQGSCFMLTREKYWSLNICDEKFGSWGSQGIEVACKTWFSGGKVVVNHKAWYAHLFRTQGGDFGFPYELSEKQIKEAKKIAKDLFFKGTFTGVHDIRWLVEKFWPVPGWTVENLKSLPGETNLPPEVIRDVPVEGVTKGILYYTDNQLNMKLAHNCRKYIKRIGLPITSVSLKPIKDFGNNIVLHDKKRGVLTMFEQMLAGLESMTEDIVFFCEHDVIYPREHFDFIPPRDGKYYYDKNVWRISNIDGRCVYYDHKATHTLCAWREDLVREYRERVRLTKMWYTHGNFTHGYEPGTRSLKNGGFSDSKSEYYKSSVPIIDVRHGNNVSSSKWRPQDFRSQRSCPNWIDGKNWEVPIWGNVQSIIQ